MSAVFLTLLNRSITAGWLVLAVMLLRLLLHKAPKWIRCVLWGFVGIRLVCPFLFESAFSLIPNAKPVTHDVLLPDASAIQANLPVLSHTLDQAVVGSNANPMQAVVLVASVVWAIGAAGMLLYMLMSFLHLRKKIEEAVPLKGNVWICDHIDTPFILGVFKPRIYLPAAILQQDVPYVLAHEKAHLQRKDHLWKPLGFLLLSVYWFHPLLWAAYLLLCKDIELACDEKVIRQQGMSIKKPYCEALVNCSVPQKMIAACPLAFGEVSVKQRVKDVLHYKKPAKWIVSVAGIACAVTAVCLLTNPIGTNLSDDLMAFLDGQIAQHHQSLQTKDNFCVVDYKILKVERSKDEVSVYAWVLYEEYSYNGELKRETSAHTPTVITASEKNGTYKLEEYWTPRDGAYFAKDIRKKFPITLWNKAMDPLRYIDEQAESTHKLAEEYFANEEAENRQDQSDAIDAAQIVDLLQVLCSSPAESSVPAEYIKAHPQEYDRLMEHPMDTLYYCFSEFMKGGQTDLRGQIMALACQDIMTRWDEPCLAKENADGQSWFELFEQQSAELFRKKNEDELKSSYPGAWLLWNMKSE